MVSAQQRSSPRRGGISPYVLALRVLGVGALVWIAAHPALSPRLGDEGLSVYYLPQAIAFYAFFRWRDARSRAAASLGFVLASLARAGQAAHDPGATLPFLGVDIASALLLAQAAIAIRAGRLGPRKPLRAFLQVGAMLAVSALAAAAATALAPAFAAAAGLGDAAPAEFFRQWLLGDAAAYATLGAVLMIAGRSPLARLARPAAKRPVEFAASCLFLVLALLYDFEAIGAPAPLSTPHPALIFLTFPGLLWLSLRFGALGACVAILLTGAPTIHFAAAGHGARWLGGLADEVAVLQAYVLICALAAYLTAALAEQSARRRRMREAALALAARREAQRADFIAGVSHEMRTPLNGVIGFAHLLRNEVCGPLPEGCRDYARAIEVSAVRLAEMIERALAVNALQPLPPGPSCEELALRRLVDDVVAQIAPLAARRDVTLDVVADEALRCVASAPALRVALTNLLTNACRHAAPGGRVVVSGRAVGALVEVAVEDDGPGFPEGFALAAGRVTRGDSQAGLGLHIADMVATMHGGTLEFGRGIAQGARVALRLPGDGPPGAAHRAIRETPP